jgi:disulfide bond formation protein DsbB
VAALLSGVSRRVANFLGAAVCMALVAYALYVQYVLHLEPCPLCIFQRIAIVVIGLAFLAAAVHDPAELGARVYGAFIGIAALAGAGVAARHIYIQHLPADQVPACGAPLEQLLQLLPMRQVIERVLRGDGECAKVDWTFVGLSMPEWVLIAVLTLGAAGLWVNLRGSRRAP